MVPKIVGGWLVAVQLIPGIMRANTFIYRLWLCNNTVLPEYVSATGPRQKISVYVSVVHTHSPVSYTHLTLPTILRV